MAPIADAVYSRPGWSFWSDWKRTFTNITHQKTDEQKASQVVKYSYSQKPKISPETIQRILAARRGWEYAPVPREKTSVSVDPSKNVTADTLREQQYRQQKTLFYTQHIQNQKQVAVRVRALKQKQSQQAIDNTIEKAFVIHIYHRSLGDDRILQEAVLLDQIEFQMFSQSGIAKDPEDFELVVNGEKGYGFDDDGRLNLQFQNARIAKGEDIELNIGVRVRNPEMTASDKGSFRLRVLNAKAVTESKGTSVPLSLTGSTITDFIAYDPVTKTSGNPVFSSRDTNIYGKTLSAGSKANVLALNFEAYYDDMEVESVILRDTLSRGTIDSFARRIVAKSSVTGKTVGSARFVHGAARIQFKNPLKVDRGGDRHQVVFEIEIDDKVNTKYNQFKLSVDPRDIEVYGRGSGKDLPDSAKNMRVDADIFEVVQSGGDMYVTPSEVQPETLAIIDTRPTQVFKFQIHNQEFKELSVARVSLDVRLSGLAFPDGRSVDDFELRQQYQNRDIRSVTFTPSLSGNDTVHFDADREIYIGRNSHADFVLKVKMENEGPHSEFDSVAVSVLGDGSDISKGTLEEVRSANANFIWSDHSGAPHIDGSDDWLSGRLIDGLPTNFKVINRE